MEQERGPKPPHRHLKLALLAGISTIAVAGSILWIANVSDKDEQQSGTSHNNVTTTVFWVGEDADESNAQIHNRSSTWLVDWEGAFGGVDDPKKRCNMLPCDFTPKENPFYFALPYSDLNDDCQAKASQRDIPWYEGPPKKGDSIVKNKWIKIDFDGKTAYAQWEDAGPMGEDDAAYVFGDAKPAYDKAGLDVSPATAEYLGLDGQDQTSWEFVPESQVPDGPWRKTITTSPPGCTQ